MFSKILSPQVQEYINKNHNQPVAKLALQKNPFPEVEWQEIINQIAAKEKAKEKLPTWYNAENIIYPPKISIEQTSSEKAAEFKSRLVSGKNLIDLTGGFGVDDYYFSKKISHVTHCEMNENLSHIVKHNFTILNQDNIICIAGDSLKTLKNLNQKWDWIYIDPSRRSDAKGKVFMLKDCLPNVPELLDTYFKYSDNILIKTAPLLDLTAGLSELKFVKNIYIIAISNEVKELLWQLEKNYTNNCTIHSINLNKNTTEIFESNLEDETEVEYSLPQKYVYEPNSAILKSGAFNTVSKKFNLKKLHKHTQLYTKNILIDFPGRKFIVKQILPYQKSEMKILENKKMNITVRNFPIAVSELRKKWKIKDGGDIYTFFTTNMNNDKIILLCEKI